MFGWIRRLVRPALRFLGMAVGFARRYRLYVPVTPLEAAVFDSIRFTVRRFFGTTREALPG